MLEINGRVIKPYKIVENSEEIKNKSAKDPKVLVTDFDDTLFISSYRQIELLLQSDRLDEYKKYLNIHPMSKRFYYDRTEYYTWKWLQKKEINEVPKEVIDEVTNYFNHPDFYKNCQPTKFAISLKEYLKQDYCEKVYVISHSLSEQAINNKLELLMDFYKDSNPEKIEFIATTDTRKSIPIIERNIKWDIFADDRLECIYDMVLYAEGFGNEILIPSFGYNKPTERFTKMVEQFNLQTFYMDVL